MTFEIVFDIGCHAHEFGWNGVAEEGPTLRTETRKPTAVLLVLVPLLAAGCSQRVDTDYGRRKGPLAASSVNGTAVFGEMFEQAGHKVFSWWALSPRLEERADCIVWFPDAFEPPREEARDWLENWLFARPGRTLIYVGRDFDAEAAYWEKVKPGAPAGQLAKINQKMLFAKNEFSLDRQDVPASEDCYWFTVEGKYRPRQIRTLDGRTAAGWREGIDPSQLEIELNGRIVPPASADVLLESQGDVLISRDWWDESQLIVVSNGSFLLNLPLVNHQHRRLAGKLIDEVGPPCQTVVFLESRYGGPSIREDDPATTIPTGLEIFNVWPTNWILFHMAVLGIIFCFSRWPIFGRPRQPARDSTSDFGKHIEALAELLQRSRDRSYAMTRLLHYQQTTRGSE